MVSYIRVQERTFWTWILVTLGVGLAIGLGIMLWQRASLGAEIKRLEHQVESASSETSGTSAELQTDLEAAQAEVTRLTEQNALLTADLAAARKTTETNPPAETATPTVRVVSRTVSPSRVASDGSITLTVKVRGDVDSVQMRITGTGSIKFDKRYLLTKVSSSGEDSTWRSKVSAPSRPGTYRYYGIAIKGATRATMPGVSPSSFKVQ